MRGQNFEDEKHGCAHSSHKRHKMTAVNENEFTADTQRLMRVGHEA